MNYTEAREFIAQISVRGSELGLTTITNLMNELGNPQDQLKFIHIAGTNGKGSVLAYLESVLEKAGYTVGRYISPTLFSYRERIQINREQISRDDFAELAAQVAEALKRMEQKNLSLPTVFEVETAISFLYFCKKACDFVLLEVGMGGRLDATNIIKTPILTILASISMDHMEFLGNTLAEIAWNKAGIFKRNVPAVSAHQEISAEKVIREEAEAIGCSCAFVLPDQIQNVEFGAETQTFTYREMKEIQIHLAGVHQIENAALALEGINALRTQGVQISDEAIRNGLSDTRWKGRFSIISREPLFILDGAHNPDAALRLRDSLERYYPNQKKYYIFGVFSDKEYDKIIEITAQLAEHIFTIQTPDNPRALAKEELAKAVARINPSVEAAESISDAVRMCYEMADKEDVILAFGSLSFLGEVEHAVLLNRNGE